MGPSTDGRRTRARLTAATSHPRQPGMHIPLGVAHASASEYPTISSPACDRCHRQRSISREPRNKASPPAISGRWAQSRRPGDAMMVTPSGFEPELREPKSLVLPLHYGVGRSRRAGLRTAMGIVSRRRASQRRPVASRTDPGRRGTRWPVPWRRSRRCRNRAPGWRRYCNRSRRGWCRGRTCGRRWRP